MIDTHSHIDGQEFAEDLPDVIERAKEAGVDKIFVPGICWKDTPNMIKTCKDYPGYLFPMIGLHPENVMDEDYHTVLDQMEKMLKEDVEAKGEKPYGFIAVGEVGIDLYWDSTYKAEQLDAFERQIQWAEKYDLPLMIHSRNAHAELMEIMEKHRASNLRGVFHCFTGTEQEANDLLSFPNFMLGIGGVLTFKKSTLREVVVNAVPLSRIVLETDSPYMAPAPNRGKRNESSYVPLVAKKLSEIFGIEFDDIVHQTTENVAKVFKK